MRLDWTGHLTLRSDSRERRLSEVRILSWLVCCANKTKGICITPMWANEIHSFAHH